MGPPFIGKTQTCISTAEPPVYVIATDGASNLLPAKRVGADFVFDLVTATDDLIFAQIENAISEARRGVLTGEYNTIVFDTINSYAEKVVPLYAAKSNTSGKGEDGRRYWPQFYQHIGNVIERLKLIPAHLVVLAHFIEKHSETTQGQEKHWGMGIVPSLPGGELRITFAKRFDVVLMIEKEGPESENRVFTTGPQGVWGLGYRGRQGIRTMPANIQMLWEKMTDSETEERK